MKKLSLAFALLAMVAVVLITGCKPAENTTAPAPAPEATNAPAAPAAPAK